MGSVMPPSAWPTDVRSSPLWGLTLVLAEIALRVTRQRAYEQVSTEKDNQHDAEVSDDA